MARTASQGCKNASEENNMLVLTRRPNEELVVVLPDGREMVISVVRVEGGNKVRLGIEADEDILVNRREIHERIKREGRTAPPLDPGKAASFRALA